MQEKTYRRLLMLQNALTTMLSHHAGLNPKAFRCDARSSPLAPSGDFFSDFMICAFRMLHCDRRSLQNPVKNILDGELLNKYLYLSMMERSELAKKIGTTQDIVSTSVRAQRGGGAEAKLVLFLSRFWTTSWISTGSPLISESHRTTSQRSVFTRQ